MECHNCQVKNMPDALFCRKCGEGLRKCAACAVAHEQDALFCRRCGRPIGPLPDDDSERTLQQASAAARAAKAAGDVDFTTKASVRRVVRIQQPEPCPPRRAARAALYIAAVLALAASVASTSALWITLRASQSASAREDEELRADLEDFKRSVAETKEGDRRAILEEISVLLVKTMAQERRTTDEMITRRVDEAREEHRKSLGAEVAKAVAKTRERDLAAVAAELAKLRDKYKDRRLGRDIDRVIALIGVGTKSGHLPRREQSGARYGVDQRQEQARGSARRSLSRRPDAYPTE